MSRTLRYGNGLSLRLDLPDRCDVAECGTAARPGQDDPAAATRLALARPLNYPPLAKCTTPGDRVVLVLQPGVPRSAEIAAAAIGYLAEEGGVDADGITVLRTRQDESRRLADPREFMPPGMAERITLQTHDPHDRRNMAYLAASESGAPILLNRILTDADLILPIGCFHSRHVAGYFGLHTAVFPTFADAANQARFRNPAMIGNRGRHTKKTIRAVDQIAWLLGVAFSIQIIPGRPGEPLEIVAGEADAVRRRCRGLYRRAWRQSVPCRADLVVAAIEGAAEEQTWDNLGRAISAALDLLEDDGTIVLCSDLEAPPGSAVERLLYARDRREAIREIRKDLPEDTLPAVQIDRARERASICLISRLAPGLVEDLQMAPIETAEQIERLATHHENCILLENAPRAVVRVEQGG